MLRNPPEFRGPFEFANEYRTIDRPPLLYQIFRTLLDPESPTLKVSNPFPMAEYLYFSSLPEVASPEGLDPFSVDRMRFEKFLYAVFVKLVLPFPRPTQGMTLINSPLNAAAFLKLLAQMHTNGFPAHWIDNVLYAILSDDVSTTARAPRSNPLSIEDSKKDFSRKRICLKPFLAEVSTLTALWRAVLGFGILHQSLLPTDDIIEYKLHLGRLDGGDYDLHHGALLFWNSDIADVGGKTSESFSWLMRKAIIQHWQEM